MAINLTPKKGISLTPSAYRPMSTSRSANFSLTEVVLLLIMIGLFSWYMILPKQSALQAKKTQMQGLENDKGKIDGEIETLNASVKTLASNKSTVAEIDEALPFDSRTTKLQMLVQYLAGQAGVSLETVSFDEDAKKVYASNQESVKNPYAQPRNLKKISGSIAVIGTFDQIQEFIGKIEKSARVLNILSMELVLQEDNKMSLKLDLEAYSYE